MGYVEQLYTFVDGERKTHKVCPFCMLATLGWLKKRLPTVSILMPLGKIGMIIFHGKIGVIAVSPLRFCQVCMLWVDAGNDTQERQERAKTGSIMLGFISLFVVEEQVLLRYELLYETGLVAESPWQNPNFDFRHTGRFMQHSHRRVPATALARLRAKIKHRPVIFELMADEFTLFQLQKASKPYQVKNCINKIFAGKFSSKT